MKTKLTVMLILTAAIAQGVTVEAPDWVNQVDNILAGVQGMQEMFSKDTELYANLNNTIEAMFSDFDRRELERKKLFDIVREKVSNLQSQLAIVETEKAAQLDEKNLKIRDLESDILAIRHETQQEIDRLNAIVEGLNTELESTRQAYATLIDMNGEKAEALISQLTLIKQAYTSMIDSRVTFLATLDRFVNRTRAYLAKGNADTRELGVELAGPSFLSPSETSAETAGATENLDSSGTEVSTEVENAGSDEISPEDSIQE